VLIANIGVSVRALKGQHIPAMAARPSLSNAKGYTHRWSMLPLQGSHVDIKKYSKNNRFDIKNYNLIEETVPDLDIFQKKRQKMDKPTKITSQNILSKTYKR